MDLYDIDDIIISKPKKADNSLLCSIYTKSKKDKPVITLNNLFIIGTKPLLRRDEFFLYLKNKNYNDFMFDLNKHIVSIIREKSNVWFNSNLNTELIDELYTNTLIYDKTHGDIMRLKFVGDQEHQLEELKNKNINITITLNHIRFYKQNFVLECQLNNIELSEIFHEEVFHSDEDVPSPTYEDIKYIKDENLQIIKRVLEELKENSRLLEHKILITETLKTELEKTMNIENITNICNELEKVWD